jgi:bleomycin hydrolase
LLPVIHSRPERLEEPMIMVARTPDRTVPRTDRPANLSIALPALLLIILLGLQIAAPVARADDKPVYRPANKYPVLEEIEAVRDSLRARRDSLIAAMDARYKAEGKAREDTARSLRVDFATIDVPPSPEVFAANWHLPPVPQFYTGTCWAFCSTSVLESEIQRLHGREIKLSEMWTVYWEYVEKARRFIREYGHSLVAEGSEGDGTLEIAKLYGMVPATAYRGVLSADGRYDHEPLIEELTGYLNWVKASKNWDEDQNLEVVRSILDKYMGRPPETFTYEGRQYTPVEFRDEVCGIDPDDYVCCVSRLGEPFGDYVLLDVPDNWRRKADYLNLPLQTWYEVLRDAVRDGYPVELGGDVSEPGLDGYHDAAVIPSFDIPAKSIDQAAREFRIATKQTTDDHGIHAVGYERYKGRDWFLIKDSNRSSRLGRFKGYYFYQGDYIKLKTLSFMVHKDRLAGLLPRE